MPAILILLWVLALACFILAAANVPTGRVSVGWLGLVFVALAHLAPVIMAGR